MLHSRTAPGSSGAPALLPGGDPVLAARVRPPCPPAGAFLRRDRLLTRLDAAVLRPVTLVSGPAGAGKTLLVTDWLARGRLPGPAGWLTLEPGDAGPGTFWTYVREALRTVAADLPDGIGVPARAEHVEPSLLLRLADWIGARDRPLVLVLDECEHLADLRLARQLHDLVRHTAGRLRLVLVGRSEPPLPLHRYRAADELAEVRAADLALDRTEAAALLERHGLRLRPATVGALHRATSGWAAGLRLLALAARDAEDPDGYLGRIGAGPTVLADFLLAEVLRTQPAPAQDLLLSCSLLDLVHPDLADALTGRRDGGRILERLHQENAFTEALPDGWYRLHPMFAGILRLHLRACAPERIDGLRVRAAHWLADHGRYRTALDHAAGAGAWGLAARLLVDRFAVGELLTGRDAGRLCALFSRMPPTERTPDAEVVRAAVHLARAEAGAALRVLDRAGARLPAQQTPLQLAAAFVHAGAAGLLGSAVLAERAARRAHELALRAPAGALDRHPELLALVDAGLGSALLWHGRTDEARRALERAARAPASPATARPRHDALCRLALIDYLEGRPGRAERLVREADEAADLAGLPAGGRGGVGALVLAGAALERDELAAARGALPGPAEDEDPDGGPSGTDGSEQGHERGSDRGHGPGHEPDRDPVAALGDSVIRAGLHLAHGRPDAALRLLARAGARREGAGGRPSGWGRERLAVTASAALLAAGRPQEAVAVLADGPVRAPDAVLAAARAALAAGLDEARALERLRELRADPAVGSAIRTRALLLLAQADEDGPDGPRLLSQALATAEPERLRRPFREAAPWVRRQLGRRPRPAGAHAWLPDDLRPVAPGGPAGGPFAPPAPAEPLTEREREVLRCAARMLSTQEIADELFLSPNTVKTHLKSVNRKLLTGSRREAVRTAVRLDLLGGR
ncbi:LuxR C-terminal-related transcriptional regulator [Kitasatospora sp. NPDC056327]|uniref:LuxR C-terminal-related transcriptional regulator n=1 Tax=Kitasatospora sp. NPDC056327 TaxID=3345785 RepID=UPI0035DE33F6